MEGISIAANGIAVISVALQLTEACIKLYKFWDEVEDAPQEVRAIQEDLQYLISIFGKIESNENHVGESVVQGMQHCQSKVLELNAIVEKYEIGFKSTSWKRRKWSSFKTALHSGHVQRFRESLMETKSTLTLALLHQCFVQVQSQKHTFSLGTQSVEEPRECTRTLMASPMRTSLRLIEDEKAIRDERIISPMHKELCELKSLSEVTCRTTLKEPTAFEQCFPQKSLGAEQFNELLLHTIGQTAIATFESNSLEMFSQDTYTIDDGGAIRARTFVYSKNSRIHVHHRLSSFKTVFGCVWIRRTAICFPDRPVDAQQRSQSITSFAIYPARWLQGIGLRIGIEAIIASVAQSWVFNCKLTVTRAVPEDSLIFELCRSGQTRAVELLFRKGLASIGDTSPKGWRPLHFAAAGGHVDLCAMLVKRGADMTALVYEGPSPSIRSPISIFVAGASDVQTETRISMLRLFSDCIDISDSTSDGWTVHEWLKRTFARERVPVSQNSTTWLLQATSKEQYVELTPKIAWFGLQHAVRSILCHVQHGRLLEQILKLSGTEEASISQKHLDSIGLLMAVRVSGRVLLPMVVTAGSFLQAPGFDWVHGHMTHKAHLQALPNIYTAWCQAVLECVENLENYMRLELKQCLLELGWNRDQFLDAISHTKTNTANNEQKPENCTCTRCGDQYGSFPEGIIMPAWTAVSECVQTGHTFGCTCQKTSESGLTTFHTEPREYAGEYVTDDDTEDSVVEDFYDAEPYLYGRYVSASQSCSGIFSNIATLLYRAQGRAWIGEYAIREQLCATCLLHQEHYINDDGSIADFPPVPEHFNTT